jgi:hypothetical protein
LYWSDVDAEWTDTSDVGETEQDGQDKPESEKDGGDGDVSFAHPIQRAEAADFDVTTSRV